MAEQKMYSLVKPASKVKEETSERPVRPDKPSMSFSVEQFKSLAGKKLGDKVNIHLEGEVVGTYKQDDKFNSSDRVELEFNKGGLVNISKQGYKDLAKK